MSKYRDDRGAARLRIEALEARLAERETELRRCGVELAARDEEIVRLQRGLSLAGGLGPRHMRSVDAAWASRIVGAAVGLALVTAGAGVILVRSSASPVPPTVVIVEAPIHADPLVTGPVDWSGAAEGAGEGESAEHHAVARVAAEPVKVEIPRQSEPRVWGGRPSRDCLLYTSPSPRD